MHKASHSAKQETNYPSMGLYKMSKINPGVSIQWGTMQVRAMRNASARDDSRIHYYIKEKIIKETHLKN